MALGDAEVSELRAYITSRASGHHVARKYDAISQNLGRKVAKGQYDSTKAVKAWRNLANIAAVQYAREFGMEPHDFKSAYRDRVAKRLRDDWESGTTIKINPAQRRRNPGRAGSAFKRCVRSVSARGGAYDPRAVCASAGIRKYGKRRFQKMAQAGKRRAARRRHRNPEKATLYIEWGGQYDFRDLKYDEVEREWYNERSGNRVLKVKKREDPEAALKKWARKQFTYWKARGSEDVYLKLGSEIVRNPRRRSYRRAA